MKKIRIAQIGMGHDHALMNLSAIKAFPDIFEFVGYAEVVEDEIDNKWQKEHRAKQKENCACLGIKSYTVEELLAIPDLEAVTIETYDLNLVKYAQMAAERGLHVFMDKPGSQEMADFEKMLSTLKQKKKVFSIGYMYRFNEAIKGVLKDVQAGKLGEIYSVEAQMNCDQTIEKRAWLKDFKGGMTFFLGCHLVDLIYSLQGVPDEIIPYNTKTGQFGTAVNDCGVVIFKYKNGVSFLKSTACEVGGFERRQLVVCGSLGTVELKPLEWFGKDGTVQTGRRVFYRTEEENTSWHEPAVADMVLTKERYQGMLLDFAQKILKGGMSDEEYEREARVHRMVLAASGIECNYKERIDL